MKKLFYIILNTSKVLLLPFLITWFVSLSIYRFTWRLDDFKESVGSISLPFVLLVIVLIFRNLFAERIKSVKELHIGNTHAILNDFDSKDESLRHALELIVLQIQATQDEISGLSVFERDGGTSFLKPSRESVLNSKLNLLFSQLRQLDPKSVFLPKN